MVDRGSHRNTKWLSGFDFERTFGYEKAGSIVGAAFAHKLNRVTMKKCLALFYRNSNEYLRCFITADVIRFHYNTPETK